MAGQSKPRQRNAISVINKMQEAIKLAIEGGYRRVTSHKVTSDGLEIYREKDGAITSLLSNHFLLLDPLFWQALGKAKEWPKYLYGHCGKDPEDFEDSKKRCCSFGESDCEWFVEGWLYKQHSFIDLLASGSSPEEAIKQVLR